MNRNVTRIRARLARSWRTLRWVLAAAAVPAVLWACNSHPLERPKPSPEAQSDLLYEINPVRKLDLIFLIDNSVSMEQEQDNLKRNFPSFMERLEAIPGGLPDTRIAILSSNFGAGSSHPAMECDRYGDRAVFQVKPGCGLDAAQARWLSVGGGVTPNFQGQLGTVFSCMASLGVGGCGYEHQLQSLRAAFAQNVAPENAGFLRDDAYLGIVILSDEDDCSGEPQAEFFRDQIPGQAGSLRCALRGHVCNDQPVPAMNGFRAPLSSCKPAVHANTDADRREKLINVATFVQEIKALKAFRDDKILVSAVIGWPVNPANAANAEYSILTRAGVSGPELDLAPACSEAGNGSAAPGIRLKTFVESFGNNSIHSICQADLKAAMTEIGTKLANVLTNTCITAPLFDVDTMTDGVQADCQVMDRLPRTDDPRLFTDTPVPACGPGGSVNNAPCWRLQADASCGSGYRTIVLPEGRVPAPGTLQSIRCLTCTPDNEDPRCRRTP